MENFKSWSVCVSAVAVISGIMVAVATDIYVEKLTSKQTLYRSGSTVKVGTYKIVVCVCLFLIILSPIGNFSKLKSDFGEIITGNINSSTVTDYDSAGVFAAERSYKSYITALLDDYYENITCECVCSFDGEKLEILNLTVSGAFCEEDEENIMKLLENIISSSTSVELRGEGYG